MIKKIFIGVIVLFGLVLALGVSFKIYRNNKPIYLDEEYYKKSELREITIDNLNNLISDKKSFAVFVYQPMCITSSDFEKVLIEFLNDEKITVYKIPFSSIKNDKLGEEIKYYPSFIIYNKGKLIDYLKANKDEHVKYYTSKNEFKKWFSKYVILDD